MKKYKLYSLAVLALAAFASCDGYEEPNPPAQSNPQEAVLQTSEVATTPAVTTDVYDLAALNEADQNIVLTTIAAPVPEGYTLSAVAAVSNNSFATSNPIATSVVANEDGTYSVVVSPAVLNTLYTSKYTMNPADGSLDLRYLLQISKDSEVATIGGPDNFYGPYTINFKPVDVGLILEDRYYLIGNMCNWTVSEALPFTATGTDPWDNPVFYITVDLTEDMVASGCYWKIIPGSVYDLGEWGSGICSQWGVVNDGETALEGTLIPTNADGEEPKAGKIEVAGRYKWTINVLEGTYKIEEVAPMIYLWTPGNSNGWFNDSYPQMLFGTDGANFTGYAHLDGPFKFTAQDNWGGPNYGQGSEPNTLTTEDGDTNINAPANGLYYCQVNTTALTYSITPISTIGIIGTITNWSSEINMTPSADFLTWTADVDFTSTDDKWKFRMNGNWDINLGEVVSDLTQGGADMPGYAAGEYTVTLNLGSLPYSCTVVKK